jgi:4-hydroxybenzoate polyprenyltransferase
VIIDRARKIIEKLESNKASAISWLIFFSAVVLFRYIAESFAGLGYLGQFLPISSLLHFFLWYALVLISISITLAVFSKEHIEKVFKAILPFFPVILISIILPFIIGESVARSAQYIYAENWSGLFKTAADFFFGTISNFSISLRLEIFLVLAFSGLYVFSKTKKIWKTITAIFVCYLIIILAGALPSFVIFFQNQTLLHPIAFFLNLFYNNFNVLFVGHGYFNALSNQSYNFWMDMLFSGLLFIPLLVVMFLAFLLYSKDLVRAVFKNIRAERGIAYVIMSFLGVVIAWRYYGVNIRFNFINIVSLIDLALVAFFFHLATIFHNDVYDYEADLISNPERPLPLKKITFNQSKIAAIVFLSLSVTGALTLNLTLLVLVLSAFGLALLYSSPPLRLKRFFLVNPLFIGLAYLLFMMGGFFLVFPGETVSAFPKNIAYLIVLAVMLAANFKDIKDYEGDKKQGVLTIPVIFGLSVGKKIIGCLLFLSTIIAPYFLSIPALYFPAIVFGVLLYWLASRREYSEKPIFIAYLCYVVLVVVTVVL